jgi:hypothetical protein
MATDASVGILLQLTKGHPAAFSRRFHIRGWFPIPYALHLKRPPCLEADLLLPGETRLELSKR